MKNKIIIIFILIVLVLGFIFYKKYNNGSNNNINQDLIELTDEEKQIIDILKKENTDTNYNANPKLYKENSNHDRYNISPNLKIEKTSSNLTVKNIDIISSAKNPYYANIVAFYYNSSNETLYNYCVSFTLYRLSEVIYTSKDCRSKIEPLETVEYNYATFARILDADDYSVEYIDEKSYESVG